MPGSGGGVSGLTGALSGETLLLSLQRLGCSGTLLLEAPGGSLLVLLQNGTPQASFSLGQPEVAAPNQNFYFQPHGDATLPLLHSRYPGSASHPLQALPALTPTTTLEARTVALRALLTPLQARGFSGVLFVGTGKGGGVLLFQNGLLGAAHFEEGARVRTGNDALRAVHRLLNADETRLELCSYPHAVIASLLGMGLELADEGAEGFSGVEVSGAGYTYYAKGEAYLRVPLELSVEPKRYALCGHPPNLHLPDEPPGWETKRFELTLRGRDALNHMTELSMRFRAQHGVLGQRVLEELTRRRNVEEAAFNLTLDLDELKPWIERLRDEGLLREADPRPKLRF